MLTLLAAAVIALVDGASRAGQPLLVRFGDATAILLIVAINAVLGFCRSGAPRRRSPRSRRCRRPNARVRRGDEVAGRRRDRPSSPATSSSSRRATRSPPTRGLLQTIELFAEESSLTGESVPVAKDARAAVADDAPLGDRATMLFVGTSVVRGKGRAVVVATGPRTELGHALGAHPPARATGRRRSKRSSTRSASGSSGRAWASRRCSSRAACSAATAAGTSCCSRR